MNLEHLTVPEVAKRMKMNDETVRRYIRSGKLPASFVGGKYLIKDSEVNKMLEG